jgi:hypothetical protein
MHAMQSSTLLLADGRPLSSVLEIQQDNSSAYAAQQQQQQQQQQHQQQPAAVPGTPKQLEGAASHHPSSITAAASNGDAASSKKQRQKFTSWAKQFALDNFMLLSFSFAAALAMAWPVPGKAVASWAVGDVRIVQAINNFLVFLISGLTLKSDDFRSAADASLWPIRAFRLC